MRIAVIGGSGFIGSFLIRRLLREGYNVLNVDIRKGEIDVEYYMADIRVLNRVISALSDTDIVFHLVGTVLGTARKNPYLAVQLDIYGTLNVLEACIRNNAENNLC